MPQSPSSSSSSEAERDDDVLGVAADIQKLIASAPESIYLDLGENLEALTDEATFRDLTEVTWSEDNATSVGIKYVRADLIATPPSLPIDFKQASELLSMFGGEAGEVTLRVTDGHSGKGLYAHYTEYPEEGAEFLGATDGWAVPTSPSPHPEEGALLLGGDEGGKKGGGA